MERVCQHSSQEYILIQFNLPLGADPNVKYYNYYQILALFVIVGSCSLIALWFLSSQLVQLDSLFAYWNVNSVLFSNHNAEEALVSHPISVFHFVSTNVIVHLILLLTLNKHSQCSLFDRKAVS